MREMLRLLTLVALLLGTVGASADTRGLKLVLVKDKADQTVTLYKENPGPLRRRGRPGSLR